MLGQSADGYTSTGQGFIGNNMFAYCGNNPVNGCDPCGSCFHRWDFWNDCKKCGGKSFSQKFKKFKKIAKKVLKSAAENVELSAGVGLGLQVSAEVLENAGIDLGISYDLIDISLVDGEIKITQKSTEGVGLTILNYFERFSQEVTYRSMPWDKGSHEWYKDDSRDAVTIAGTGGYFFAGFSASVGFDYISFLEDMGELIYD